MLPNCVKNGTLGGSKPNGSPSPISALSRSPAPAPASGRACSAARATALADSDESIEKIDAVSQHIRKNTVDLKLFLVCCSLAVTNRPTQTTVENTKQSYSIRGIYRKDTTNITPRSTILFSYTNINCNHTHERHFSVARLHD